MQEKSKTLFLKLLKTLNEAQGRWLVAKEALDIGRGGISQMNSLTGMSRKTILKGVRDLKGRNILDTEKGIRKKGGGRDSIELNRPEFLKT